MMSLRKIIRVQMAVTETGALQMAKALKITPSTWSRKMNDPDREFTETELKKIFKLLKFTNEQIAEGMK